VLITCPTFLILNVIKKDLESIHWALQFGMYDVRQTAANFLGELKSKKSIRLLSNAVDDKIKNVSFAAMDSLWVILPNKKVENKIKLKKEFWISIKEKEIENRKNRKKPTNLVRNERTSKKTFENIKNLLRKPTNTGKWF
jgi:hypothetical protein